MTQKGIQNRVADNTQRTRRVESNFIEVADRGRIDLTFARNNIEVELGVRLYKRDLNGALVSGHSSPVHGSGRGRGGDLRGEWTFVEDETTTATFTKDGRNATRDLLDGQNVRVRRLASGTVDTAARTGDSELGDEWAEVYAWGDRDGNVGELVGEFRFHETGDSAVEFGVKAADGTLLGRLTVEDILPSSDEEVRAVVSLTVEGDGAGNSVVTSEGEEAVADSLVSSDIVGLHRIAFGSGRDTFSKGDTALTDEVIRKAVDRNLDLEVIRAFTNVYKPEPDEQPVDLSEISVEDNEGRMLWASTFDPEEKNEDVRMAATVGFRLR